MSHTIPVLCRPRPSNLLGRIETHTLSALDCAGEVQVFSLAPMMEYTDRHMRFLLRLLTKRTVLWTEMVPSPTITHNSDDLARFLDYNEGVEHPVVLQVCCGVAHTGMPSVLHILVCTNKYCCTVGGKRFHVVRNMNKLSTRYVKVYLVQR